MRAGAIVRGTIIGRYTILSLVGQGGMGEVYAAYDPELDRKVALKLLRKEPDGDADATHGRARLLREAKTMAKVSHPNVVAVHDAGTFGARVFLAMEFVDGLTLRDWLAERPRGRDEILAVFIQAAHGLMAAHAAGLVHRDFKPGNVMIGRNGSVRVTDFGLARSLGATSDGVVNDTLTATEQLLGTPRYMAPEQFKAEPTDARADQFSFCVALYEALYGVHPFGDGGLALYKAEALAGRVRPATSGNAVPAWLRRVLLRGLAVAPDARWPSMANLTAVLQRAPARAERRRVAVASGALLVVLASVALAWRSRDAPSLCRGGPARLAGLWEIPASGGGAAPSSRRQAAQKAFLASGSPVAAEAWERTAPLLDAYVAEWLATYRDTCETAHVAAEGHPELGLDLQMSCLDARRTALAALTELLATADRDVVANAVDAARALPDLVSCRDLTALRASVEAPRDAATRARAEEIRERLATAKATNDTGKHRDAIALSETLVAEARRLGYRPVLAETLDVLAQAHNNVQTGLPLFEEASLAAFAAGRNDLAAKNAVQVVGAVALFSTRLERAQYWSRFAHALLDQRGEGATLTRAWLAQNEGLLKKREHDVTGELALVRTARALKERTLPPGHPDIASSAFTEADALHALGRTEEALAMNQHASRMWTAAYGPRSIEVAFALSNEGEFLVDLGRSAEALEPLQRAVSTLDAHFAGDEVRVSYPLTSLGRALIELDRAKEAIPVLTRALRLREANEGDPSIVAETRLALARALRDADARAGEARGDKPHRPRQPR